MTSVTLSFSIRTKYFGPSNVKGSRIKAQLNTDGASVTIPYPSYLSGIDCHLAAVEALCAKLGISDTQWLAAHLDNGYIFISTEQ